MLFGLQPVFDLILIVTLMVKRTHLGKTTGCIFGGHWNPLKASNPYTLPNSSHPRHIRLHLITPGSWVLCWGSSRVFGSFTTRNPTCGTVKLSSVTSASKYFETGITSLLAANNQNNECASARSPADLFNKGKIFLLKYFSHINITIDPESRRDGIFWPRMSIVMDRHCEIALFNTHCLVSKDTT